MDTNCHCGKVTIQADTYPTSVARCNCSICRRTGALWAYYDADQMTLDTQGHKLSTYQWGDKRITFHSCHHCGCLMYHSCINQEGIARVGINARMAEPEISKDMTIRLFDGADSWTYIEND